MQSIFRGANALSAVDAFAAPLRQALPPQLQAAFPKDLDAELSPLLKACPVLWGTVGCAGCLLPKLSLISALIVL